MDQDQGSNVFPFPTAASSVQHGAPAVEAEMADRDGDDAGVMGSSEEMRAMMRCLSYLHKETQRLEAGTASRLIGAAVLALKEDIAKRQRGQ